MGFDPIWFGVIIVLIADMGIIIPPVGVSVFVIKGTAPDIPLHVIFMGIVPFLVALILFTIVLIIFPSIATYLPRLVTYQARVTDGFFQACCNLYINAL